MLIAKVENAMVILDMRANIYCRKITVSQKLHFRLFLRFCWWKETVVPLQTSIYVMRNL